MHIAHIVPSLANKGPIIVVMELVASFIGHGHNCTVFYFDDKIELSFNCPIKRISKYEKIDFSKFDVVHSHGIRPDRYIFKYRPKENPKILFVSTLHNNIFIDLKYEYSRSIAAVFGRLWLKWISRHDILIALSKDATNYYSKWFSQNKLVYAYNTRNLDITQKLSEEDLKVIVAFKGTSFLIGVNSMLTARKGIDILIRALPSLMDYKLVIVGEGKSRKSLQKLSKNLKVENRCLFVGYKPNAYRYMSHYDLYAMPSLSEGFGLVLLEAAIYNVPTVASNLPVFMELFSPNEVSFFALENPNSIIQAIIDATSNLTMANKMNQKFHTSYSPELQYNQYLNIYNKKF